ncbi:MAG TPA: hypothetical protein VFM93_08230 [Candidatus Limnocylindria bacterium]|nr:hypothetical protein [Candidatus Limnocylindria bacterium]
MRQRIAVPLITLAVGIPAFLLSQVIWPPAPGHPTPSGAQLPLFILLFVAEALLFGLGVAFIAFGSPLVRQAAGRIGMDPRPVYVAIAWQLVSWWPHDNFHMATGMDLNGLLMIEYAFHVTLMLSALVVARFFFAILRAAVVTPPVAQHGTATGAVAGWRG